MSSSIKVVSGSIQPSFPYWSLIMATSFDRLFWRKRSVHEILGGGIAADIILWRRKNVTLGILFGTLSAWMVFELSGYTLMSLVANVLLLLLTILFIWAKAAGVLNRPPPPIPKFHLTEDMVNKAASFLCLRLNTLFSVTHDIALGKDSVLFFEVAVYLWLLSLLGGLFDVFTLSYIGLALILALPRLYEMYEDQIDRHVLSGYAGLHHIWKQLDNVYCDKLRKLILKKRKLG